MRKSNDGGAQGGDPEVPIRLATFDQYRSLLFSVAYRMLGSVADAEDMLQETFIRWQQAPDDDIRSPRAFLVTIISRLCINHLQSARVQREEYWGSCCRSRSLPIQEAIPWRSYGLMNRFPWRFLYCSNV